MRKPKPSLFFIISVVLVALSFLSARFIGFSSDILFLIGFFSSLCGLGWNTFLLYQERIKQRRSKALLALWAVVHFLFLCGGICLFFIFVFVRYSIFSDKCFGKYMVNHQNLLEESRQMIHDWNNYRNLGDIHKSGSEEELIVIKDTKNQAIPESIRGVSANYIALTENRIIIAKRTTRFKVYKDGLGKSNNEDKCEKLIEGLFLCTYIRGASK